MEIRGMGVIEVEKDECMSLGCVERGEKGRLERWGKNVVEW